MALVGAGAQGTDTLRLKVQYCEGTLVVLVDGESAWATEMFARVVQLTRRGTVIGDRTMGAVMRNKGYSHSIGNETIMAYGASVTVSNGVMVALRRALALGGVAVSAEAAGRMLPDRRGESQ